MRRGIILRRICQSSFFILFVYILWSTTYPLNGLLPAETFFKLNPLIIFVTSLSERLLLGGIIFSALMLGLTLVLGRFFCGWICPLGAAIDFVGALKKSPKLKDSANRKLSIPKFILLAIIFIFALIGVQIAWVFDPMVIMARFVSLNLIPIATKALDSLFIFTIKAFKLYGPVYDFYRSLQSSVLGVKVYYFSHSLIILLFFLLIVGSALKLKRFWCRAVCPLGALYAFISNFSFLGRRVDKCSNCKACQTNCRMGAIRDDLSYTKPECVLCLDCVYDCPTHGTRFTHAPVHHRRTVRGCALRGPVEKEAAAVLRHAQEGSKDGERSRTIKPWSFTFLKGKKISQNLKIDNSQGAISRRSFLILLSASLLAIFGLKNRYLSIKPLKASNVIRPPAALKEDEFLDRCIRCGNCMKVCITNGLQPVLFQCGLQGIWTPQLVPEIGYCEYNCTLCGNVCPTRAIPRVSLEQKHKAILGIAKLDRSTCLPWAEQKECIVCEEHCPISDKAIKLKQENVAGKILLKPYVDSQLCNGCGICENKCPVRPARSIKVYPLDSAGLNKGDRLL